ncbi:MAG: hypothetical protein QOH78_2390 [Verrucomicrobiota bacterium]
MPLNSPAEHIPGFEYRATPAPSGPSPFWEVYKDRWESTQKVRNLLIS